MRKRFEGFTKLFSVDEAKRKLMNLINHRIDGYEEISTIESLGRVCYESILSPINLPEIDRSAVDGYAVVAEDTFGASPTDPVKLKIIGTSYAGIDPSSVPEVSRGFAVEVFTGAPIPRYANAVVMVEHTKRDGDTLYIFKPVSPMMNISRAGEDFKKGDVVIEKGTRIRPWHIAALSSLNIRTIKVLRKPRVSVISTGNELVELGSELKPGKIINSTKPMIMALLEENGCDALDLGIVPDDIDAIRRSILNGLGISDAVILTGGTSVGGFDLVPEALSSLTDNILHGIRMRPGRPTGFGVVDGKPVFMLSGFPVAALVGFQVFVKPALNMMQGLKDELRSTIRGRLTRSVTNVIGTMSFVRVKVFIKDRNVYIEPLMLTGSGLVSTLTKANGMLVIEENVEGYSEGDEVEVELFNPIEVRE